MPLRADAVKGDWQRSLGMTPERWQRIREVAFAALELGQKESAACLVRWWAFSVGNRIRSLAGARGQ